MPRAEKHFLEMVDSGALPDQLRIVVLEGYGQSLVNKCE